VTTRPPSVSSAGSETPRVISRPQAANSSHPSPTASTPRRGPAERGAVRIHTERPGGSVVYQGCTRERSSPLRLLGSVVKGGGDALEFSRSFQCRVAPETTGSTVWGDPVRVRPTVLGVSLTGGRRGGDPTELVRS
jgi:hypothetical protein